MDLKVKSRIWVESDSGMVLGNGRIRLLKAIEETGSLSKAAEAQKMSYKKAWHLIDSVNQNAHQTVVEKSVGGKNGGGATLTEYGKKLIADFESLNQQIIEFIDDKKLF